MSLDQALQGAGMEHLIPLLRREHLASLNHGDLPAWLSLLDSLPVIEPDRIDLTSSVTVGSPEQCVGEPHKALREQLMSLIPWRKGPFNLFGIDVDTEWRSNMKWDRVAPFLSPLQERTILDAGCGNGYHCLRMAGAGAGLVVGIDPHLPYVIQFHAIRHFLPQVPVGIIPARLEDVSGMDGKFDTVFSMGVIYHRRSPLDHLMDLKNCLRRGGELVLETLVANNPDTAGTAAWSLTPPGRYARMSNVWFLPSCVAVETWLHKCGFTQIRLVDVNTTRIQEQRRTEWMPYESLTDALDATAPSLTVEGLPAPERAVFIAQRS
ncbi:MAG: tRNA 5-methoxyuridine(34)/uridine 5-oxyacetic acid(34) synthase CmoB [Pseudohongiellaceae bacterium]